MLSQKLPLGRPQWLEYPQRVTSSDQILLNPQSDEFARIQQRTVPSLVLNEGSEFCLERQAENRPARPQ
jgi:hypothetical protein